MVGPVRNHRSRASQTNNTSQKSIAQGTYFLLVLLQGVRNKKQGYRPSLEFTPSKKGVFHINSKIVTSRFLNSLPIILAQLSCECSLCVPRILH